MRQDSLLKLVDLVYAAAYDRHGWTAFLNLLSDTMGGSGADLGVMGKSAAFDIQHGVGIVGPQFLQDYLAHFSLDPYVQVAQGRGLLRTGTIGLGDDIVPARELERSAFYNEFGRRYDYHGGLTAVVAAEDTLGVTVNVCRRRNHPFGKPQVMLMRALMPHLQRAIQIHLRLAQADARSHGLEAALNALTAGAILVDAHGVVVFVNDTAQAMLAQRKGLTIERGQLRAGRPTDTSALYGLIGSAVLTKADGSGGGGMTIGRPGSLHPLQIAVAPVPARDPFLLPRPLAVVFVNDPEDVPEADPVRLQRGFGFSRMEAAVAAQLLHGKSVREIAADSGISVNTVRSHLKQLFSKTGTARQGELIRLLATSLQVRPGVAREQASNQP